MEPSEKFIRKVLTVALMIVAFIVSTVFGELHGVGWIGVLIYAVGVSMGALGVYLWKSLKS
jgi:hypothetical protein